MNPNGFTTNYYFQYGTSTSYGSSTPVTTAGSGKSSVPSAASIANLLPNNTYHFRIEATNFVGTSYGNDSTFTTLPTYSISGYVRDISGTPIPGVTMYGLTLNPVTGPAGYYAATVSSGRSGTVFPTLNGYLFSPSSKIYSNVMENKSNENYSGAKVIWHVDGGISLTGDGISWATAFKTIQEAVITAGTEDEIWVKQGIYELFSSININKTVSLYAGFAGTETQADLRNWNNNIVIIDGNRLSSPCLNISANALVDGFTITKAAKGGISISSPGKIDHCKIFGNGADTVTGGGMNITGPATITNCMFSGNRASERRRHLHLRQRHLQHNRTFAGTAQ